MTLNQFLCGLTGHDRLPHFEKDRMSLRCCSCKHETPGWDLRPAARQPIAKPLSRRRTLPTLSSVRG